MPRVPQIVRWRTDIKRRSGGMRLLDLGKSPMLYNKRKEKRCQIKESFPIP